METNTISGKTMFNALGGILKFAQEVNGKELFALDGSSNDDVDEHLYHVCYELKFQDKAYQLEYRCEFGETFRIEFISLLDADADKRIVHVDKIDRADCPIYHFDDEYPASYGWKGNSADGDVAAESNNIYGVLMELQSMCSGQ